MTRPVKPEFGVVLRNGDYVVAMWDEGLPRGIVTRHATEAGAKAAASWLCIRADEVKSLAHARRMVGNFYGRRT